MTRDELRRLAIEKGWWGDPYGSAAASVRIMVLYRGEPTVYSDEPSYTNGTLIKDGNRFPFPAVQDYWNYYSDDNTFIVMSSSSEA